MKKMKMRKSLKKKMRTMIIDELVRSTSRLPMKGQAKSSSFLSV